MTLWVELGFRCLRSRRLVGRAHALSRPQIRGPGVFERGGEGVELGWTLLVIRLVGRPKPLIIRLIRAGALDELSGGRGCRSQMETLGGLAYGLAQRLRAGRRGGAKQRDGEPQEAAGRGECVISP